MSYSSEAGEAGSASSPSDGAPHESVSSRGSQPDAADSGGGGDGSESESYVEVEQLGGDDAVPGPPNFAASVSSARSPPPVLSPPPGGGNGSGSSAMVIRHEVRHVAKRTLITLQQRRVLEDYYRGGMTSASQQMAELHEAVAAKTGLDLSVVRVRKPYSVRTRVCAHIICKMRAVVSAEIASAPRKAPYILLYS